jgi:5-methylcytosine-specific restriction endonuclease McrA
MSKTFIRRPVLARYTKEEIETIGRSANSPRDFMLRLGYKGVNGTSYTFFCKKMTKMGIEMPEFKYVEHLCVDCGKKIRKEGRCAKCAGKLRRKENNSRWTGRTHPRDFVRESHKMKMLRREVLKRDGYKCVECGATNNLVAHHVFKSFKTLMGELIDAYGDSWLEHYEEFEPLWDLTNFTTLCRPCHHVAHKRDKIA